MSGDLVGLDDIKPLSPSPPTAPDHHADKEIERAKKRGASVTPSDRHDAAVKQHIADLTGERNRYRDNYEKANEGSHEARRLRELLTASVAWDTFSTLAIAGGGILVSSAGYFESHKEKILFGGYGVFIVAILSLILAKIYVWFRL